MIKTILILISLSMLMSAFCSSCKKNILERKLNRNERTLILRAHNHIRKTLEKGQVKGQPRALKMPLLKWDSRLAKQAQKIADTCKFKHVEVKDARWSVGQNLHEWSSTRYVKGLNATAAVYSWINENKWYHYPKYTRRTGHYTQVIWADTRYVGCGYTHYKTKGKFKYHKLLVCNYGPAGNVQGSVPYKRKSSKTA